MTEAARVTLTNRREDAAGAGPVRPRPVAPVRHTVVFVGIFAALALAGALAQARATGPGLVERHPPGVSLYLSLIAAEWGLVYFVWKGGLRETGTTLGELVGGRWRGPAEVGRDLALGFGLWMVWSGVGAGWDRWLGPGQARSIGDLLPQGALEGLCWVALSLSAGFCEELAFRGYLQRQLQAWTGNAWAALLLQAVLFGVAHGYQGVMATARIALFGLLYGLVAQWRGSLRPGMVAHAWTDVFSGLLSRLPGA